LGYTCFDLSGRLQLTNLFVAIFIKAYETAANNCPHVGKHSVVFYTHTACGGTRIYHKSY